MVYTQGSSFPKNVLFSFQPWDSFRNIAFWSPKPYNIHVVYWRASTIFSTGATGAGIKTSCHDLFTAAFCASVGLTDRGQPA